MTAQLDDSLYVTDAELCRRLGLSDKFGRRKIKQLDDNHRTTGFPQRQAFWGNRRYWPAVKAFLDRTSGFTIDPSQKGRRHG